MSAHRRTYTHTHAITHTLTRTNDRSQLPLRYLHLNSHRYAAFLSSGALPGALLDPASLARMRSDLETSMRAPAAVSGIGYKDLVAEADADSGYRWVGWGRAVVACDRVGRGGVDVASDKMALGRAGWLWRLMRRGGECGVVQGGCG